MGKTIRVAAGPELMGYGPRVMPAWHMLDVVESAQETIERVLGRELAIFSELFRVRARGRNRRPTAVRPRFKRAAKIVRL